ncbi:MAG: hypothetical protein K2I78_04615 [Clostridia bacterium]|nr:hypothetical protein [Clostridia bacterium]MDE7215777.1 hypothetical protein [Clostridia bacterium]
MLSFIELLYRMFVYILTDWKLEYFIVFFAAFPFSVLLLQSVVYASRHRYLSARIKLGKFLKKNSFVTPRNFYFFNKKVVGVFPKSVKKQVKHIVDGRLPIDNAISIFKSDSVFAKPSIVKAGFFIHIVSMGVIMSVNGFELTQIAFVAFAMCFVWIGTAVADAIVSLLIDVVDRRNKKKFVFALERNLVVVNKEIDLGVPSETEPKEDSVSALAKSIEDFLASNPDKGMASVVLKSLYSASFSGAMTPANALRLKNVMLDLKKYVG